MTPLEIAEFIAAERTAIMCTLGPSGRIHAVPMWFVPDGDCVVFSAKSKSQKVVNARRISRATILIEAGDSYFELRGVQMAGVVELIDDAATVLGYVGALSARYEEGIDSTRSVAEKARNRSVIRFVPDWVASWDHRKLRGNPPAQTRRAV
jgi:PPOX class probable F420-dependent enzyme